MMKVLAVVSLCVALVAAQEEPLLRRRDLNLGVNIPLWGTYGGRVKEEETVETIDQGRGYYYSKGGKGSKGDDDDSSSKSAKGPKGDSSSKSAKGPKGSKGDDDDMSMSMYTRKLDHADVNGKSEQEEEGDCFMGAICENSGGSLSVCCEDETSGDIGCSICGGCKSDAGLPVGCCASNGEFFMPPFNCGEGELCCNVGGNFMCTEAVGGMCPSATEDIVASVN